MDAAPAVPNGVTYPCGNCGVPLIPGKPFCKECGRPAISQSQSEIHPAAMSEIPAAPAVLLCAHCGAEVAAGKAFCRKCGHAVAASVESVPEPPPANQAPSAPAPVAVEPSEPVAIAQPVTEPLAALEVPAQTPSATLPQPVPVVETPPAVDEIDPPLPVSKEPLPAEANQAALALLTCAHCAAVIAVGKSFCHKCGHAVAAKSPEPAVAPVAMPDALGLEAQAECAVASAPVADWRSLAPPVETPHSVMAATPSVETPRLAEPLPQPHPFPDAPFAPLVQPGSEPALEPASLTPESDQSEPLLEEPTHPAQTAPPVSIPPATPVPAPVVAPASVAATSWGLAGILAAVAALLIAAIGVVWFFVHHPGVTYTPPAGIVRPDGIPTPKPAPGVLANQTPINPPAPVSAGTPEKAQNPLPITKAVQEKPLAPPQRVPPAPAPVPLPQPRPVQPPNIVMEPTPAFKHPDVPAPSQHGALHYSGPPVAFGGLVVFRNLPKERMHFTFDHSAWQPLIQRSPDGTQILTLRSIKQGLQTGCDVNWEINP